MVTKQHHKEQQEVRNRPDRSCQEEHSIFFTEIGRRCSGITPKCELVLKQSELWLGGDCEKASEPNSENESEGDYMQAEKRIDDGTGAQLSPEVSVDVEPSLEAVIATELTVSETAIGSSQQNESRSAGRDLCIILGSFVNRVFNIYWVMKTSNSPYSGRLSHRL